MSNLYNVQMSWCCLFIYLFSICFIVDLFNASLMMNFLTSVLTLSLSLSFLHSLCFYFAFSLQLHLSF